MSKARTTVEVRRILVVEDEPGLQEALVLILEMEGFEILRANDGKEGLACLEQGADLVLTDFMMPRMNGHEMISAIRDMPEHAQLPIILMSAALPQYVDKSLADAFLQKPVTVERLVKTIGSLLIPA